MFEDIKGKTALITGSGKRNGIGYAIAYKMASCGVNVIIADLGEVEQQASTSQPQLSEEMLEISTHLGEEFKVQTMAVNLDVTCQNSITRMVETVKAQFSGVDYLFNNAGVALGVPSEIRNYDETAWMKTVDVNLHGVFRVSKAILPLMENRLGNIVNIASRAGKVAPLWNGAYAVSKAGVIMLTKVLALELAELGIRVNAICPGLIMTDFQMFRLKLEADFFDSTIEERENELRKRVPQGRLGTPAEVAALAAYLVSKESSYITGQAINVCGGQTLAL